MIVLPFNISKILYIVAVDGPVCKFGVGKLIDLFNIQNQLVGFPDQLILKFHIKFIFHHR